MILSHEHKFIFICNGKTGTTSIEKQLMKYQEGAEYEVDAPGLYVGRHIPALALKEKLPAEIWDGYYKFGFVRNPFDWFISVYFWNMLPGPWTKRWQYAVKQPVKWARARVKEQKYAPTHGDGKLPIVNIDACRTQIMRFRALRDATDLLQCSYLGDLDGNILVDKVGRFESLEMDFEEICQCIGIETPALQKNNATRHKPFQAYYTPKTRAHVARVWKTDFDAFSYDPDPDWNETR